MNCDRIARWYRWLEYGAFGGALQSRREAFLRDIASARRVLVLGDGDGRGLQALLQRLDRTSSLPRIDYVDCSLRMLELAQARVGACRVAFHHANALDFVLQSADACRRYDLVVSHFFLDCLNERELEQLLLGIKTITGARTKWVISEFRNREAWSKSIIRLLYSFFWLTTGLQTRQLVDYHPYLLTAGFRPLKSEHALGGLLISELWGKEPVPMENATGSEAGTAPLDDTAAHVGSSEPPGKSLIGEAPHLA